MDRPVEVSSLRRWFVATVAIGSAGIFAGWLVADDSVLSKVLTFGVPLFAMAGYMVIAHISDRAITATEQFADSIYFLGFLLTLVSLMVSLLAFADSAGRNVDISGVVSRFGVALATTVVGLACRIYLINFRSSIEDSVAQNEKAIAIAGSDLRTHLEQLSQDMVVQSKLMNDSLNGALIVAASELKAVAEASKSTVTKSAAAFQAAVSGAATQVEHEAMKGGTSIRNSLEQLAESIGEARLPQDALVVSLTPAISVFTEKIGEYGDLLEQAGASHSKMTEEASALSASVESMRKSGSQLSAAIDGIGDSAVRFGSAAGSLGQVTSAVDEVRRSLAEQADLIAAVRTEAIAGAEFLSSHAQQSQDYLVASRESLEQVRADLVAAADFVRRELKVDDLEA
jgi:hypothetical protein